MKLGPEDLKIYLRGSLLFQICFLQTGGCFLWLSIKWTWWVQAALAFFNWGNVYMCAARKRIPVEAVTGKTEEKEQFQAAYDWAQSHYKLAGQKYEEALRIKPDFYEVI